MRTVATVTALTLASLLVAACNQGGDGEEGGLEIGEDSLRIDVEEEELDEAARDAREAVEGALEEGERAVGAAMEKTGQAIEGAAEETGAAVDRAMEKTGETLEREGREMQEDGGPERPDSL